MTAAAHAVADWRYPEPADTWPEPYRHTRPADPWSSYAGRGDRVRIMVRCAHAGQVGRVTRTELDGGELLLTVRFDDGSDAQFWEDEVLRKPLDN